MSIMSRVSSNGLPSILRDSSSDCSDLLVPPRAALVGLIDEAAVPSKIGLRPKNLCYPEEKKYHVSGIDLKS